MNVEVLGYDKFMGCSCSGGEKGTEVIEEDREWFRMSGRRWRTIDIKNHIHDLVMTSSDTSLAPAVSCTHWSPSDHFPVFARLVYKPSTTPSSNTSLFPAATLDRRWMDDIVEAAGHCYVAVTRRRYNRERSVPKIVTR